MKRAEGPGLFRQVLRQGLARAALRPPLGQLCTGFDMSEADWDNASCYPSVWDIDGVSRARATRARWKAFDIIDKCQQRRRACVAREEPADLLLGRRIPRASVKNKETCAGRFPARRSQEEERALYRPGSGPHVRVGAQACRCDEDRPPERKRGGRKGGTKAVSMIFDKDLSQV